MARQKRNDKLIVGFWLGMVFPIIIFSVMYLAKYSELSLLDYLKNLWQIKVLIKLMSLCVFPNLLIFLFFYRKKYDMAARGVIMATFIYAFIVLISTLV